MEYKKSSNNLKHVILSPLIYSMIIPLVILDFFLEIYHHIYFNVISIPMIKRENYIRIDRHKLSYLGLIDKVNCAYCGYGNGLLNYASKIAGETEKYWCGIKHDDYKGFKEPKHHKDFLKYNDKKTFQKKFKK